MGDQVLRAFEAGDAAATCARYAGRDAFAAADRRAIAQGLRLASIDLYLDSNTVWCTGVWVAGEGRSDLQFTTQWDDLQHVSIRPSRPVSASSTSAC